MNILAIDTSGPVCGAAVLCGDIIRAEITAQNKLTHSVNLMPMIDEALRLSGCALSQMDVIAVTVGPGSFTGVRIGVSTVKGLAHGSGKPCIPINALEAMAAGVSSFGGMVCPIQDARAGQVYGAAFMVANGQPERLLPDAPLRLEDYVAAIQEIGNHFLFTGDGMPVHRERLSALLGDAATFASPAHAFLRPAAVATLAAERMDNAVDYLSLMPLYLRAPSAERNRKLVEAAQHGE